MDALKSEILGTLRWLLDNPKSTLETVLIAVVTAAACIGVVGKSLKAGRAKRTGTGPAIVGFVVALVLAAMLPAVVKLYLVPKLPATAINPWLPAIVTVLAFAAIVVPVLSLTAGARYMHGFLTTVLGAVAAAVIVFLGHAVFEGARSMGTDMQRAGEKTRATDEILK